MIGDPAKVIDVCHSDLLPYGDSCWKRICPSCDDGILAVTRDPLTLRLLEYDHCLCCGQGVRYLDIEAMRRRDGDDYRC